MKRGDKVVVKFEGVLASDPIVHTGRESVQVVDKDGIADQCWVPAHAIGPVNSINGVYSMGNIQRILNARKMVIYAYEDEGSDLLFSTDENALITAIYKLIESNKDIEFNPSEFIKGVNKRVVRNGDDD
jgi:hypothetical protein